MSEGQGKKSSKPPITSKLGTQMSTVLERIKMHKADKTQHSALLGMHDAVLGRAPRGILKCAYDAGHKYAEDTIQMNQDDDKSSPSGPKNEEEALVDVIRRGWPNVIDSAMRSHNKITNKQAFSDSASVKDLAKINANSPEVTV